MSPIWYLECSILKWLLDTITGFRRDLDDILVLQGWYAAYIGSYQRFETNYRSKHEDYLTLEDGTDRLSPNVGNYLQIYAP